jgi:16S rRNA C1402 (ribose-2'-O) methylase RsmI
VRLFAEGAVEQRGEWVLLVGPSDVEAQPGVDAQLIGELLGEALDAGTSRRGAVDEVVAATGAGRRAVYRIALELKRPSTLKSPLGAPIEPE